MINLGQKSQMYPATPTMQQDPSYPRITLPMDILNKRNPAIGDIFEITLKGKITALREDDYGSDVSFEVTEGEVETADEEKAENDKGQD